MRFGVCWRGEVVEYQNARDEGRQVSADMQVAPEWYAGLDCIGPVLIGAMWWFKL